MKKSSRPGWSSSALLVLLCLLPLLKPERASAGEHVKPYALIFGTVWGPDEQAMYGVKVKIRRSDQKKAKWELYSDHRGEFAQRVPAGSNDYIVWADLKPQKGQPVLTANEVKIHIENDERQDIGLHLKNAGTPSNQEKR